MSTATVAPILKVPAFAAPTQQSAERPHAIPRAIRGAALLAISDTVTALAAMGAVLVIARPDMFPGGFDTAFSMPITLRNIVGLLAMAGAWPLLFLMFGVYRPRLSHATEALRVAVAMAACVGAAAAVFFIGRMDIPGPFELLNVWWSATALLLLTRAGRRAVLRWRGVRMPRRVLIVGAGPRAAAIHAALSADEQGSEVVGFVDDDPTISATPHIARRIVGTLATLESMLMRHAIDEVVVALPVKSQYRQIQNTLRICESVGVRAKYRADLFQAEVAWPSYEPADSHFVTMQVAPDDARLIVKRAMDIAGSALLILLFSPVMIAVVVAVKLTSAGPIIFAQERYGLNRRPFRMFKFRTMVANAAQLQQMLEDRNEVDGPVFKISNDPRVTPVGRFLRRTSIDELPQLFNVLKGDMSLVGPRPLPLRDIERFTRASDMRRCSVRPGITCLWQVSGRNNLTFEQWMHLDLQYIDRWSLLLDAVILARTVPAVLHRTGAH